MFSKQRSLSQATRSGSLTLVVGEASQLASEPRLASEPLTDKVLVQRAARGDEIAFSELVNRHYRRALRVAFGLLKDRADAEDVLQEAFARVHSRLKDFEGSSAFYTWLYRIVVNLSIDSMRKRRRERRADVDEETTREAMRSGEELWPRYRDRDPSETTDRKRLAKKLEKAFAGLPEIHQAVIVLRELEGFSYEEIAETLGIKKGTVMSRLFHARRGMQQNLLGEDATADASKAVEFGS
jgi:RNA polymerase sigma-70 factor (ECF subfamily)